jgi:metal-responsive CopG/Arc/MetJ family transcriptional regulator
MAVISISMTDAEAEEFDKVAKALGIKRSELWRRVWRQWTGNEPNKDEQG